jgi:hypothetical protein
MEQRHKFKCEVEALDTSSLCIFHDKNYLQAERDQQEHEQKVVQRLRDNIINSISHNEPLRCIGYHLPNIKIQEEFTKSVYFYRSKFLGNADFSDNSFLDLLLPSMNESNFNCFYFMSTRFSIV